MWTIFPPCFTARVRLLKLKITCTPFLQSWRKSQQFFMWFYVVFSILCYILFSFAVSPGPGPGRACFSAQSTPQPPASNVNCLIHGSNKRKVKKENTEPNSQKALGSLAPTVVDVGAYSEICVSPPESSIETTAAKIAR